MSAPAAGLKKPDISILSDQFLAEVKGLKHNVAAELLARRMSEATKRGQELGLNDGEMAFYDALAANKSAVKARGNAELKVIAAELVTKVRQSVTNRLDRPRKRTAQDQGDGETRPEEAWLPAGLAARGGEVLAPAELLCAGLV